MAHGEGAPAKGEADFPLAGAELVGEFDEVAAWPGKVDRDTDDDPPRGGRHHEHLVGEQDRLGDRVRHEEHRRGGRLPEGEQFVTEHLARQLVEGREGLVHEQHLRLEGEGEGDRHPLAHPARELGRAVREELAETEGGEDLPRGRAAGRFARRFTSSGRRTFSSTVRQGSSPRVWGTKPMCLFARARSTGSPKIERLPESAVTSPATIRRSVVLPQPLGPMRVTKLPRLISISIGARAATGPEGPR